MEDGAMTATGQCAPILDIPRKDSFSFRLVFGQLRHESIAHSLVIIGAGEGGLGGGFLVVGHAVVIGVRGDDGDVVIFVVGREAFVFVVGIEQHVVAQLVRSGVSNEQGFCMRRNKERTGRLT